MLSPRGADAKNRSAVTQVIKHLELNSTNADANDAITLLRKGKSARVIRRELVKLQKNKATPYKIGSGDKFNLSIYREPELSFEGGVVKPDGTLTIPMVGDVKVSGLSINQAMVSISEKLKKYMKDPIVSLIPLEFRAQSYTILGKVNAPGNYPVYQNSRILDTIADAKGLSTGIFQDNTIELADLDHAFIRRGKKTLPVNFTELVKNGNALHNIPLQDKDYIYIPSSLNTEIYVLGEVKNTGYYGYRDNITLIQILGRAGGYLDTGNINEVAILRGTMSDPTVYVIDLEKILEGKAVDFKLKPFDVIFVPKGVLGSWNTLLKMINPSLQTLTNGYIVHQILSGETK
jgi:polysaccharide export outer membrane protein